MSEKVNPDVIGSKLRTLRGEKTLEEAAKELDISPSTLGMYEQGRRVPRDNVKIRIAKFYNVSIEEIFFS